MTAAAPRHKLGLALIALLIGSVSTFLWIGRWKLAIAYALLGLLLSAGLLLANAYGPLWPASWNAVASFAVFYRGIVLLIAIVALLHAYKLNVPAAVRPWYSRWYVALILPLAIALSVAFAIRTFVYQPFNAPSESSIPNQIVGDYFFVSKSAYKSRDPQRGETAVFRLPSDPRIQYIKRVIGLPGDRIQMRDGILILNGTAVPQVPEELDPRLQTEPSMKFFRETLPGGASYVIADLGETSADNTEEYLVPPGHYFTLGDNRDNSQDSRYLEALGYVPRENFVGPLAFSFWNENAVPLKLRPQEIHPRE